MLHLTLLIFVKEGKEQLLETYEEKVLPLLPKYNGELLYRVRPAEDNTLTSTDEYPYEIHIIRFASRQDFERYKKDPLRRELAPMQAEAIDKTILIEGIE